MEGCDTGSAAYQRAAEYVADRFLNARFFSAAGLLVAVTDDGRQAWIGRSPEVESKSAVIWNGYDPEEPIVPSFLETLPPVSHFESFYVGRNR